MMVHSILIHVPGMTGSAHCKPRSERESAFDSTPSHATAESTHVQTVSVAHMRIRSLSSHVGDIQEGDLATTLGAPPLRRRKIHLLRPHVVQLAERAP